MDVFTDLESEVRSYCRSWPTVFDQAKGSRLHGEDGTAYLDFFAGAGALNYGHNHPHLKAALLEYIERDGVVHSLDMSTVAKRRFLERFDEVVLTPRGLDYKVQFPGPTGTNAVEAALKLARKVTGREHVLSFTNAFHGMTLGSLAVTGNSMKRGGAGVPLGHTSAMPYCGYMGDADSLDFLDRMIGDDGSGVDHPAAVIVETTQGEGGLQTASDLWLAGLAAICAEHGVLLIVDDVQMGCGRTGPFLSFERAGITPDIVCMSKSISGYGLPMALTLLRRELDVWDPGEHNGTFRGHNPAFVTGAAALDLWEDGTLELSIAAKAQTMSRRLSTIAGLHTDAGVQVRGRGLIQGLVFDDPDQAGAMCRAAYERGLLMETSGPSSEVAKLMPPITIDEAELDEGLDIVEQAAEAVLGTALTGTR